MVHFDRIINLDVNKYIYENNFIRTLSNAIYEVHKEFVCTAGEFMAIFPDKSAYSCYNLKIDEFLISEDISIEKLENLEKKLMEKKELLKINNYSDKYRDVEYYGDYCPKENNFDSFAYKYRKNMVDVIKHRLAEIKPGSKEHLAVLGYLAIGYDGAFFDNFWFATMGE